MQTALALFCVVGGHLVPAQDVVRVLWTCDGRTIARSAVFRGLAGRLNNLNEIFQTSDMRDID